MYKFCLPLFILYASLTYSQNFVCTIPDSTFTFYKTSSVLIDADTNSIADLLVMGEDLSGPKHALISWNPFLSKFDTLTSPLKGWYAATVKAKDFNLDAKPDLVISGYYNHHSCTSLYLSEPGGNFKTFLLDTLAYCSLLIADLNNDGFFEIIVGGAHNPIPNKVFSQIKRPTAIPNDTLSIIAFAAAEVNYNGYVSEETLNTWPVITSPILTKFNAEDIVMVDSISFLSDISITHSLVTDMNKDAKPEIIIGGKDTLQQPIFRLYEIGKDFNLHLKSFPLQDSILINSMQQGDLNTDGYTDLIVSGWINGAQKCYILVQDSLEQFTVHTLPQMPITSAKLFIGDFDNDGYADILCQSKMESLTEYSIYYFKNPGAWKHEFSDKNDSHTVLILIGTEIWISLHTEVNYYEFI